ncbi:unnamed protein product [Angiostrongylus costaricensis]|uniref:CHHC U11-48K-type domain-containing protein n=1 Tax=Angiostrongylus costaricensis TaxID=334426 RepID=A0A0R3Q0S7_ANGCS|nr:unnamed protein product [Angiostrongylus costaricensis]
MVSKDVLNHREDDQTQCMSYGDSNEESSYRRASEDYTCAYSANRQCFDDFHEQFHCRQNDSMDEDRWIQKVEDRRNSRPSLPVNEERVSECQGHRCLLLQTKSKESRWLLKDSETDESIEQRRDSVVMCRYNPAHVLDEVDIGSHEKSCKDRSLLKCYGIQFNR